MSTNDSHIAHLAELVNELSVVRGKVTLASGLESDFYVDMRGLDLDAFVVRKAAKDHGMRRRIEGPDVAGRSVVVLEDTSTTGGSPLEAVEALREAGADVRAVAVIVDRATGARERIEAAGLPYYAALGLTDLGLE